MSRMSELDAVITELRRTGEAVVAAADALRDAFSGKSETTQEPEQTKPKAYSIEDVRSALLSKMRQGFKDDVKELLRRHGAERLPDVDPSEYAAMMKEAEAIGQ